MERELILTGIGGQGIQLAAAAVARAAVDEGREVQVFGSYGGMMPGGATESTVVVADGPVEARRRSGRPGRRSSCTTSTRARPGPPAARQRGAGQHDGGRPGARHRRPPWEVGGVPATDLAVGAGHLLAASMVMIGAYAAVTGLVALESLVRPRRPRCFPPYRAQHAALNEPALRVGYARRRGPARRGLAPAGGDRDHRTAGRRVTYPGDPGRSTSTPARGATCASTPARPGSW